MVLEYKKGLLVFLELKDGVLGSRTVEEGGFHGRYCGTGMTLKRFKTFMWLLVNDDVMTNVERVRRLLDVDGSCSVCGTHAESSMHFLRNCGESKQVWESLIISGMSSLKKGMLSSVCLVQVLDGHESCYKSSNFSDNCLAGNCWFITMDCHGVLYYVV